MFRHLLYIKYTAPFLFIYQYSKLNHLCSKTLKEVGIGTLKFKMHLYFGKGNI